MSENVEHVAGVAASEALDQHFLVAVSDGKRGVAIPLAIAVGWHRTAAKPSGTIADPAQRFRD
jgi:hypothetical protein